MRVEATANGSRGRSDRRQAVAMTGRRSSPERPGSRGDAMAPTFAADVREAVRTPPTPVRDERDDLAPILRMVDADTASSGRFATATRPRWAWERGDRPETYPTAL